MASSSSVGQRSAASTTHTVFIMCLLLLWLSTWRKPHVGALTIHKPNLAFVSGLCNNEECAGGSYAKDVESMLTHLERMADSFPVINGTEVDGGCFGSRSCYYTDDWFTVAGCRTCFEEGVRQLRGGCPNRIGAQIVLQDCALRYENYKFF